MTATLPNIMTAGDSPRVRRHDPITSHEAADSNDIHGARAEVMFYLGLGPVADHELVAMYEADQRLIGNPRPYTPQRLRTARHELTLDGLVSDAGYFHLTATGRRATVWSLT